MIYTINQRTIICYHALWRFMVVSIFWFCFCCSLGICCSFLKTLRWFLEKNRWASEFETWRTRGAQLCIAGVLEYTEAAEALKVWTQWASFAKQQQIKLRLFRDRFWIDFGQFGSLSWTLLKTHRCRSKLCRKSDAWNALVMSRSGAEL